MKENNKYVDNNKLLMTNRSGPGTFAFLLFVAIGVIAGALMSTQIKGTDTGPMMFIGGIVGLVLYFIVKKKMDG